MAQTVREHAQAAQTDKATTTLNRLAEQILEFQGSRGELGQRVGVSANGLAFGLNIRPRAGRDERYEPALTVVVGENESSIALFAQQLINATFEQRRSDSILYPIVSFVFDEADVFISSDPNSPGNVIGEARLLARRGRKFGLGLGIATQRIIYLDSSIMAQPHTYFISKLPRESDRNRIAEAFAISPESLEQTFAFTAGQWLVASHDATGLKGTPFPVQLPNANDAVRDWLEDFQRRTNRR
jgi:DNA helicase HerA-like ATPase